MFNASIGHAEGFKTERLCGGGKLSDELAVSTRESPEMSSTDAILQAGATMIAAMVSLPLTLHGLGLPLSRSFLAMIMLPVTMYCGSVILAMSGNPRSTTASKVLFALASALAAVVFAAGLLQR